MELLQLKYFKTIADCQHITKAANQLNISQPSLSNTLSRIEHELGVQLFDRLGRNITINSYGEILLKHANNILRELDNLKAEIDNLEEEQHKTICINSTDSIYSREWLPKFIREHPDIALRHSISTDEKIRTALLNGTLDFGISSTLADDPCFNHLDLWEDEYVVLVPQDHAMEDQSVQKFISFKDDPFIALPKSEDTSRSIDLLSDAAGFVPNIIFEGERDLIVDVFIPLHCDTIVLNSTVNSSKDTDFVTSFCKRIRLKDPQAHFKISLVWDKERVLSPTAQKIIAFLKQNPALCWHLTSSDINPSEK